MQEKVEVFNKLFATLKTCNYAQLQYIPTRKSVFGIFKEWENLSNLAGKKKHLMFYFSLFPSYYLKRITSGQPNLRLLYDFCFLNKHIAKNEIEKLFGNQWIDEALMKNVLTESQGKYLLLYSVLPVYDYLILRDSHNSYLFHQHDERNPKNRVWVGSDSVKFVEYNQKYLKGRKIKHTLELGCGTGIQLICTENISEKLTGIDINPRAVEFTQMSANLNSLENRFTVILSDLFEKLTDKYDAILANPWFIDIEKGGLEEIPDIIEKLDSFLEPGGIFVMYFSSYVKNGVDQGHSLLTKFAAEKGYDAVFHHLGKTIEPPFLDRYKKFNISHINNYYAILEKNGTGKIKNIPTSATRQLRDAIFIPIQKMLKKSAHEV